MPSLEVLGLQTDFQKFRLTTVLDFLDVVVVVVVAEMYKSQKLCVHTVNGQKNKYSELHLPYYPLALSIVYCYNGLWINIISRSVTRKLLFKVCG